MPLCASPLFPQATICQEWPGTPAGQQTVSIWDVGVSQLTSPTSVLPGLNCVVEYSGGIKSLTGFSPSRDRARTVFATAGSRMP